MTIEHVPVLVTKLTVLQNLHCTVYNVHLPGAGVQRGFAMLVRPWRLYAGAPSPPLRVMRAGTMYAGPGLWLLAFVTTRRPKENAGDFPFLMS